LFFLWQFTHLCTAMGAFHSFLRGSFRTANGRELTLIQVFIRVYSCPFAVVFGCGYAALCCFPEKNFVWVLRSHLARNSAVGQSHSPAIELRFENCAVSRTAAAATLWRALAFRLAKSVSWPRRRLGGVGLRPTRCGFFQPETTGNRAPRKSPRNYCNCYNS
jgi:hypothetical protein